MLDVSNLKKITEKNKTVLIRFDLNVPLNSIDDYISDRIIRIKKPILNLLNGNNKVIILSHLGRPKGKIKDELSLQQVVPQLESVLEKNRLACGVHTIKKGYRLGYLERVFSFPQRSC